MATKKPSASKQTKKTRPVKKTAAKTTKPAATKARAKSTAAKKRRPAKAQKVQSFRPARNENFMCLSPSIQTVYWLIIGALVIGLALWVYTLHQDIQELYDQIDQTQLLQQDLDARLQAARAAN